MKRNIRKILRGCPLFLLLVFMVIPVEIRAEGVRARYLENSADRSILEITIEDPAPSSIIVKQRLPQGARIQSASPAYSKFAPGKNEVKWLFKRPVPGVKRIVLKFTKPLSGKGATAVIRCKSPRDGALMTILVE
jgi:hypothetical protein